MDLVKGYNSEMDTDSDIEEVPLPPKHVELIDIDLSDSEADVGSKSVPVSNTNQSVSNVTELKSTSTKPGHTTKESKPDIVELDSALAKSTLSIKEPEHAISKADFASAKRAAKEPEPAIIEPIAASNKTIRFTNQPETAVTQLDSILAKSGHAAIEPEPVIIERNVTSNKTVSITRQPESAVNQLSSTSKAGHATKEPEPDIIELDCDITEPGDAIQEPEPTFIDLESASTEPDIACTNKPGPVTKQPEPISTKVGHTTRQLEPVFTKPGHASKQPEPILAKSGHTTKQPEPVLTNPSSATQQREPVFSRPGHTTKEPEPMFIRLADITKELEPVFSKPVLVTRQADPIFTRPGHTTKEPDLVLTKSNQAIKEPQQIKSVPDGVENENDEINVSGSPVISRDERKVLASNDNLVCRIPRHLTEIKNAHKDLVSSLDWCTVNNPSVFLSSSWDGFIKLWDVINMNLKHSLKVSTQVTASKWSLDGAIIFTGGSNKKVAVYEAQTVQKFIEYDVYCKVYSMAIHPYIHDVVLVGLKNIMLGYDLRVDSLLPIRTFPCKCEEVLDIAFLDDNIFVSSGNISFNDPIQNRIMAWEFGSSKALSTDIFSDHCVCPSLKLHPSDSTFIAQTTSNYIATFSSVYPFAMKNKKFAGHNVNSQLIECDISPDGKYVATGDANGAVHFYSYAGGNQVYTSSLQSAGINRIKWNPCITSTMITSSVNGNVQIWN